MLSALFDDDFHAELLAVFNQLSGRFEASGLNADIKNNGRRLDFEHTYNGLLAFLFAEF